MRSCLVQLMNKLGEAESHIETLTSQLADLGTSEAIQRAREQHESVVEGMRRKHESEALTLRQQLDDRKRELEEQVRVLEQQVRVLDEQERCTYINFRSC